MLGSPMKFKKINSHTTSESSAFSENMANYNQENQKLIWKIIGNKSTQMGQTETGWTKQRSTLSKFSNITKNLQNQVFILSGQPSSKIFEKKQTM